MIIGHGFRLSSSCISFHWILMITMFVGTNIFLSLPLRKKSTKEIQPHGSYAELELLYVSAIFLLISLLQRDYIDIHGSECKLLFVTVHTHPFFSSQLKKF